MRIAAILLVLFFVSPLTTMSAQTSEYIGYRHKPVLMYELLPNGVKDLGGGIIMDGNKISSYGIGRFSKGTTQMLWLELATGEDANGVTGWEVKDVLVFPELTRSQELFFAAGNDACTINGKNDGKLVVFADFSPLKKKYTVRKAWRANLESEKFRPIPIKGIRCEYYEP